MSSTLAQSVLSTTTFQPLYDTFKRAQVLASPLRGRRVSLANGNSVDLRILSNHVYDLFAGAMCPKENRNAVRNLSALFHDWYKVTDTDAVSFSYAERVSDLSCYGFSSLFWSGSYYLLNQYYSDPEWKTEFPGATRPSSMLPLLSTSFSELKFYYSEEQIVTAREESNKVTQHIERAVEEYDCLPEHGVLKGIM